MAATVQRAAGAVQLSLVGPSPGRAAGAVQIDGGTAAITPGVGTLTLTGLAPTVTITSGIVITPGVGTLTLTGLAPTAFVTVQEAPGVGTLTLTGLAPTVTVAAGIVKQPGVGTLTLTGLVPTVSVLGINTFPGVGTLTLQGFAPTATISGRAAAITGTVTTAVEPNIVEGGRTIIITLTNDTWVGGPAFDLIRGAILGGLDSDGSETFGWNNEVRDKEVITAVVRTSDTVVTITLSPAPAYDITQPETITVTAPALALTTSTVDIIATPTFTINLVGRPGGIRKYKKRRIMVDGQLYEVRDREEERAILEAYIGQQQQVLEIAEPQDVPKIQVRIRRAERRVENVEAIVEAQQAEAEEAERRRKVKRLRDDDEIILALMMKR